MALKLLHTADWHLGCRFAHSEDGDAQSFSKADATRLSQARLEVVREIFKIADHKGVDAILCAGDLFDVPNPPPACWQKLAELLKKTSSKRPVFLLPGNHDPVRAGSVYDQGHPFRQGLPSWVHVIDADDFTYELKPDAVLHGRPCRSSAGDTDLALALPARLAGDDRIRIGLVHGQTFDIEGCQAYFPISKDAAIQRGFDYLAIGDTHAFQNVRADSTVPVVYPSAPEATNFKERNTGYVAIVLVRKTPRKVDVLKERVGKWIWLEQVCKSLDELRALQQLDKLDRHVLRVILDLTVSLKESTELEGLLAELKGTETAQGLAGIMQIDRAGLRVVPNANVDVVPASAPKMVVEAAARLQKKALAGDERARLAFQHLWRLAQEGV